MKPLLTIMLMAVAFAFCNQPANQTIPDTAASFNLDSAKQAIVASNTAFSAAIKSGDSVTAANGYTNDAVIMPPNMPAVKGRAAIVSFAAETSRMGPVDFALTSTEVSGNAESIDEVGTYAVTDDKGTVLDKGKFICIWRKEDGKWKIFRDIFNSDLPPAPHTEMPVK